jgi:Rad3-related DNA helicase
LKDRQVSERLRSEGGQLWYAVQVARTFVQMIGRGVRSEDDRCAVYVLDRNFGKFWGDWGGRLFPSWMTEALV